MCAEGSAATDGAKLRDRSDAPNVSQVLQRPGRPNNTSESILYAVWLRGGKALTAGKAPLAPLHTTL